MARVLCKDIEDLTALKEAVAKVGAIPFRDENELNQFFTASNYIPTHDDDWEYKNAEWLKIKHYTIGGSEAGVIMGLSPFVSPTKLAVDKIADFRLEGGVDNERQFTFDIGHQFEPVALLHYQRVTGGDAFTSRCMYQADKEDYMIVDLDGLAFTPEGELRILEFKFINNRKIGAWKSGVHGEDGFCASPTYYAQCQHAMYVMGENLKELFPDVPMVNERIEAVDMVVGASNLATDVRIVTVKRDDDFIKNLVESEAAFWDDVQNGIVPKSILMEEEKKKILEKFQILPDEALENLAMNGVKEEVFERILALKEQKAAIKKDADEKIKMIDNNIDQLELGIFAEFEKAGIKNGDFQVGNYEVGIESKTSISYDYAKMKKVNPAFFANYAKEGKETRKVSVKKLK